MSKNRIEINSELIRGERVVCEDCREENDPVLWKTLYLALRDPGKRLSKHDKAMVDIVADGHLQEHPDHRVIIEVLKKLSPWGWFS